MLKSYTGRSRAFLKVQDGCDAYCTYCIIPKIRTKVCSKDEKNILQEARDLIAAGHNEIVLTGIFLGAYGQTTARRKRWDPAFRDSLAEMVAQVAALPGLARLRLSSLEPADVTDRLLEVFKSYPTLMPHLHLPLQSGSGRILKRMARQYTIEQFMDVVGRKSVLDRPAITTDIIVGFPGESEEDFEQTLDISRRVGFPKSTRSASACENTLRTGWSQKFPPPSYATAESPASPRPTITGKFRRQFVGQTVEVIVDISGAQRSRALFYGGYGSLPDAAKLKKGQRVRLVLRD